MKGHKGNTKEIRRNYEGNIKVNKDNLKEMVGNTRHIKENKMFVLSFGGSAFLESFFVRAQPRFHFRSRWKNK